MAVGNRGGTVVVVMPGPATGWACDAVAAIVAERGIGLRLIDRTDDIDLGTAGGTVHLCQFPGRSVIAGIEQGQLEAVLLVEDPLVSVAHAMGTSGSTFLEAVRSLSASLVANLAIGRTSRSRLVFPAYEQPALATARRLAGAMGLGGDPATLGGLIGALAPAAAPEATLAAAVHARAPVPRIAELSEAQRRAVLSVAAGAIEMAQGNPGRPIVWPTEVFFSGDRPNEPAPRIAPVMGPSRVMLYGPYLHLPPAAYRVELIVAFSGRIEDVPFLIEVHGGAECLARYRIQGRRSGGYRGWFRFRTEDPVAPIEIRLRNEKGAIEGEMALIEIGLHAEPGESAVS